MKFDDKVYNVLKWLCLICLPALAVFYTALDNAFAWGYANTVATVLAALSAFIGSMIGISTNEYNKEKKDEDVWH